jgi:hypothetical protein
MDFQQELDRVKSCAKQEPGDKALEWTGVNIKASGIGFLVGAGFAMLTSKSILLYSVVGAIAGGLVNKYCK